MALLVFLILATLLGQLLLYDERLAWGLVGGIILVLVFVLVGSAMVATEGQVDLSSFFSPNPIVP